MKNRKSSLFLTILLYLLAGIGMTACEENTITAKGGDLPRTDGMDDTFGMLKSSKSAQRQITMSLYRKESVSDKFYFELTKPAEGTINLTTFLDADLGQSYVDSYNEKHKPEILLQLFPKDKASITQSGKLSIATGKQQSESISITFTREGVAPGNYLLPVSIKDVSGSTKPATDYQTLYYGIIVRENAATILPEKFFDFQVVGYINTEETNPLVANQFALHLEELPSWDAYDYRWFDIINLLTSTVRYNEAEQRAELYLHSDIRWVLDHTDDYIVPLQEQNTKVCLTVKGGGQGIGFCNLNDKQISDLAYQLKSVVVKHDLDGINLYDEGAGYGKEGMPAVNPTSYPKLIKILREMMPDKLITLTDVGSSTADFNQIQEGIEIGKYIDYAWSGYMNTLTNPWEGDNGRKPIAGLDKSQYGGLMYDYNYMHISDEDAAAYELGLNELVDAGIGHLFVFYKITSVKLGLEAAASGGITMPMIIQRYMTVDWETGYFPSIWTSEKYQGYDAFDKNW